MNINGTKVVIDACLQAGVPKLVYTSSVGVTWRAEDIHGLSEDQLCYPKKGYDMYHHTKAIAEKMVLEADGRDIRTTVIRPCGMVGCVHVLKILSTSKVSELTVLAIRKCFIAWPLL